MTAPSSTSGLFDYGNLASRILKAHERIRPLVRKSRVEELGELLSAQSVRVFGKMENEQKTGSFKLRGATNRILRLFPEERRRGVVAASNGNHGLGVAAAASCAGISADVFVSSSIAASKAERIEAYGARIHKVGNDPLDAELAGREAAERSGCVFISPYNDWDVLAGQGTIAIELCEQVPQIDAIFVVVGGGGLIGGIGGYLKYASPKTEIVGCWPENSPVLFEAMKAGRIVPVDEKPTLSESTAGGLEEDSITLAICKSVVDSCVLVSEEEILDAMRLIYRKKNCLIEGAAGVALAAFLKSSERYQGKTAAVVICGGNLSEKVRVLL